MKPYEEMSDAELSEAFALQVAGWTRPIREMEEGMLNHSDFYWKDASRLVTGWPNFAKSADAVLPWLSKPFTHAKNWKVNINFSCLSEMHYVTIYDGLLAEEYPSAYLGVAPTLARAACLALLNAKKSETAT